LVYCILVQEKYNFYNFIPQSNEINMTEQPQTRISEIDCSTESISLFNLGSSIHVREVCLCFLILIGSTVLIEGVVQWLDYTLEDSNHWLVIVNKVYKELMILGLISYVLFCIRQANALSNLSETWLTSFEFCHTLLFFVGIAFAGVSVIVCVIVVRAEKTWERIEDPDQINMEIVARQITIPKNSITRLFMSLMSEGEAVHYMLLKHIFISRHRLPSSFEFKTYVQMVMLANVDALLDIEMSSWLVMGAVTLAGYAATSLSPDYIDTQTAEHYPVPTLYVIVYMFIGIGMSLVEVSVYLVVRNAVIRVIEQEGFRGKMTTENVRKALHAISLGSDSVFAEFREHQASLQKVGFVELMQKLDSEVEAHVAEPHRHQHMITHGHHHGQHKQHMHHRHQHPTHKHTHGQHAHSDNHEHLSHLDRSTRDTPKQSARKERESSVFSSMEHSLESTMLPNASTRTREDRAAGRDSYSIFTMDRYSDDQKMQAHEVKSTDKEIKDPDSDDHENQSNEVKPLDKEQVANATQCTSIAVDSHTCSQISSKKHGSNSKLKKSQHAAQHSLFSFFPIFSRCCTTSEGCILPRVSSKLKQKFHLGARHASAGEDTGPTQKDPVKAFSRPSSLVFAQLDLSYAFPFHSFYFYRKFNDAFLLLKCLYLALYFCYFASASFDHGNNAGVPLLFGLLFPTIISSVFITPRVFKTEAMLTSVARVQPGILGQVLEGMMNKTDEMRDTIAEHMREVLGEHRDNCRLNEMFRAIDLDGDGTITAKEFQKGLAKLQIFYSPHQFNSLMRVLNPEGGKLRYEEFADFIYPKEHKQRLGLPSFSNLEVPENLQPEFREFLNIVITSFEKLKEGEARADSKTFEAEMFAAFQKAREGVPRERPKLLANPSFRRLVKAEPVFTRSTSLHVQSLSVRRNASVFQVFEPELKIEEELGDESTSDRMDV